MEADSILRQTTPESRNNQGLIFRRLRTSKEYLIRMRAYLSHLIRLLSKGNHDVLFSIEGIVTYENVDFQKVKRIKPFWEITTEWSITYSIRGRYIKQNFPKFIFYETA
jgi:hypothetical protein